MIFGGSSSFTNSATESVFKSSTLNVDLTPMMLFIRIGEAMASIILFVIGLVMTDWRNEGYAWFLHNSIMGVTVLATLSLLI